MIKAFLHSCALFVAEEAASWRVHGSLFWLCSLLVIFFNLELLIFIWLENIAITWGKQALVLILRNTLENATCIRFRVLLGVLLFILLVLLWLFVLLHLFSAFEKLVAWMTLISNFCNCASISTDHLRFLFLKYIFWNWCQFSHSSLCIVQMIFSRQMQFVIDHRIELNVACWANDFFLQLRILCFDFFLG